MSKYWREASSLIIAAKILFPRNGTALSKSGCTGVDSQNKNIVDHVKESERLRKCNFKILALKRSSKASYMPDSFVFPGGNTDVADSSKDWLDLYNHCGITKNALQTLNSSSRSNNKIDIFECQGEGELFKSLSLRITAIRETFEESGVLLCKSKHAHSLKPSQWASYLAGQDIQNWQKRVQNNANEFIDLCRHFECYPDVWSLQEWSNWLTPTYFTKRFNTIFFLATVDHMPPVSIDYKEVNDTKWATPDELLDLCNKQEVLLPPPQYYELSRLNTFDNIEQLAEVAAEQNRIGAELWMPLRIKTSDGEVTILPGDDMYPSEPDFSPNPLQKVEDSVMVYRRQSHRLHRMEHTKECNTRLVVKNIDRSPNHILPLVQPF